MSIYKGDTLRHCSRCDTESKYLIRFMRPNNVTEYVCWRCVKREDKRMHSYSLTWTRQRRQPDRMISANGVLPEGMNMERRLSRAPVE